MPGFCNQPVGQVHLCSPAARTANSEAEGLDSGQVTGWGVV